MTTAIRILFLKATSMPTTTVMPTMKATQMTTSTTTLTTTAM
jgi:hypothetical protein